MKNIGSLLLLLGVGTIVLNLIGYEFAILFWIDQWGENAGWAIRAAMIIAGGVLYYLGHRAETATASHAAAPERQEPTLSAAAPEPANTQPADPQPAPDPAPPPQQQP